MGVTDIALFLARGLGGGALGSLGLRVRFFFAGDPSLAASPFAPLMATSSVPSACSPLIHDSDSPVSLALRFLPPAFFGVVAGVCSSSA